MFGLILLSVITLLQLYVFRRVIALPYLQGRKGRVAVIFAGGLLWVIFAFARLGAHEQLVAPPRIIELIGMDWMGVVFLLATALLAAGLVPLPGAFRGQWIQILRGGAVLLGLLFSALAMIQGVRAPEVVSYEVRLAALPPELDGTVIAGVSDLHLGTLLGKSWLEERVAQIAAEKPDLIVLLGDLFEGHGPPGAELLASLGKLSATMGVWAVAGNHEFYGSQQTTAAVNAVGGLRVLENSWVEVRPGLVVAGVDDLTVHRGSLRAQLIPTALAARPPGATILLSHSPLNSGQAAAMGVGLMLSGHTHGGQIWPFGYLVKLFFPLFAGSYEVGEMTVIVGRGTGTWGPRMRLWRRGEIIRVTLRAKGNKN